ncbi:MAG: hypothetical protein ACLVDR_11610 [Sellimonas intestinalis]|jgi:hypothetical protein|nr:hypothetical protein [uncultured Sellimonas sp.]
MPRQSKARRGKGNAWLRGAMAEQGEDGLRQSIAMKSRGKALESVD